MSFPRYPKYKPSGVEWLGDVPEHWETMQSRRLFRPRNEMATESDRQVTASQQYGILYQEDFVAREGRRVVETIMGTHTLRRVMPNDFVISLRSFQGGIEWSQIEGAITFHYVVLTPIKHVYEPFFAHMFKSMAYIHALRATTNLIRDGQDLRFSHFVQVDLPIIPEDEQAQIAGFLDRETSKIDGLVGEQRRLIELLKEKRQAVISHAVTKGLNPHAPLKPSGIEWLGEIPAHWRGSALKHLAKAGVKTFTDGDWIESPFITSEGVRLIQTGNVGIGFYKEQGFRYVSDETFEKLNCTEVKPRDVLICRLDGPVGRACLAPDLGGRMITSVDNAILKTADDVAPEFVVALLSSVPWISWIDALCRVGGGFRLRVSRGQLGELRVPVPPFEEQLAIAKHLETETAKWDELTAEAERAIELLQERRTALISAAVTGKINVLEESKT